MHSPLKNFTLFALLVIAINTLSSNALALGDVTQCRVSSVKDAGDFENEYDFEFSQNQLVIVDLRKADDKMVVIGALSFSEQDSNQPSSIRLVQAYGAAGIEIAPEESDERFYVRVDFRRGTGELQRQVGGVWIPVADLTCSL